ncbi:MAG: class I SAM-dependent methyltransferase [Patescibacteria group bacterium]|nr:class I SAM-dependent methyltransferase [Patescibacteria group bacterium]
MFVNPIEVLNQLELKKDMTAADFGSGAGGWTIPLAKILEKGYVFAVDIQEEPLSALGGKAKSQNILNIKKIIANVEERIPQIPAFSCDLVLMTDFLFQIEEKEAVFQEAKRILKPGGKILVVEWKPEASLGPKEGKVSQEEVKEIAKNLGFNLEKEFKAGDYHYGLIFIKP